MSTIATPPVQHTPLTPVSATPQNSPRGATTLESLKDLRTQLQREPMQDLISNTDSALLPQVTHHYRTLLSDDQLRPLLNGKDGQQAAQVLADIASLLTNGDIERACNGSRNKLLDQFRETNERRKADLYYQAVAVGTDGGVERIQRAFEDVEKALKRIDTRERHMAAFKQALVTLGHQHKDGHRR